MIDPRKDFEIQHLGNRVYRHPSGFSGKDTVDSYHLLWFKDRNTAMKYIEPYLKEMGNITSAAKRFFISQKPYGVDYPSIPLRFKVQFIDYCTYIVTVNDGPSLD